VTRGPADGGRDGSAPGDEVAQLRERGEVGERGVRAGVQGDLVPLGDDLPGERGMRVDALAEHEERRPGPSPSEDVEHDGGALGVGPVVEGERHERLGGGGGDDRSEEGLGQRRERRAHHPSIVPTDDRRSVGSPAWRPTPT
jgi:hypothetical protein